MENTAETKNLSLTQKVILAIILAPAALGVLTCVLGDRRPLSPEEAVALVSKRANERCPTMVAPNTRLDSTAHSRNTLINNYTVLNIVANDFDVKSNFDNMRSNLIENYKSNPGLEELRKRNIRIAHAYRDKTGAPIITISISPSDF